MMDYFTTERIKATLFECERQGLTAMQMRGDRHIMRMVREYRNEGGKLHWIAQIASELSNLEANIRQIAACGGDALAFVPPPVALALRQRQNRRR